MTGVQTCALPIWSNMRFAGYPTTATLGMPLFQKMCQLISVFRMYCHLQRVTVFTSLFRCPAFRILSRVCRSVGRDLIFHLRCRLPNCFFHSGIRKVCIFLQALHDFLRKIVKGGADKSYGIQVAKLAGVPDRVINRAKELVEELTDADIAARAREIAQMQSTPSKKRVSRPDEVDANQLTLFDTVKDDSIIEEIKKLEIANMTPLDALNTLYRMQATLKNRI